MDYSEIFGNHTKDLPGLSTVRTLEKRKFYIMQKLRVKIEEKSFLVNELRSLEKVINFITWLQNNRSNDAVRELIKQYKADNGGEA